MLHFRWCRPGYSDGLRRLVCETCGWGTAILSRRSCPYGHGFGSLFSGLLRSVAPLIRRGAVVLGKRALTIEVQITGDVVVCKNVKKAAKANGNGCRKKPDAKLPQNTTTSR